MKKGKSQLNDINEIKTINYLGEKLLKKPK